MSKIILVFPKTGPYEAVIKDLPLSVLYASRIVYDKGYDIKIIDQRIHNWKRDLLKELNDALLVGISSMTGPQIKYALEISKFIKENSKVPVVWGGHHPTQMPEQTLENPYVDMIICGYGEFVLYELVISLEKNKSLKLVNGLGYKKDDKIIINPFKFYLDIDKLPKIPYSLIEVKKYYRAGFKERYFSIITSEGCPHRCSFCHTPNFWKAESVDKTINHLKYIMDNYKPSYIYIADNDFFVDLKRCKEIFKRIKKENFNISFGFRGVRVDELDKMDNNFLKLMESINVKDLQIGAESGSQRVLDLLQKDIKVEQTIRTNRKLKNYPGLLPSYNFFTGVPTETTEDLYATTSLIIKLLKENPFSQITGVTQFAPYPGTKLFEFAKQYGYKPPTSLEGWSEVDSIDASKNSPWVSKKHRAILDMLYYATFFIDKKIETHFNSNKPLYILLRLLAKSYRPIAKFRFKNHISSLPLEVKTGKLLFNLLEKRLNE